MESRAMIEIINGIEVEFAHRTPEEVATLTFEYLDQAASEREAGGGGEGDEGNNHAPKSDEETP
jgi:hypothetical protein